MKGKVVSLIGALFCFSVALLFLLFYNPSTNVSFYPPFISTVNAVFWVGGAFLIAFGLFFLRDYFRS